MAGGIDMDELICRLVDCVNELDEIADELEIEYMVNARAINTASDIVDEFKRKLSAILDMNDEEPDLYHMELQERLDKGDWE